MEQKIVGPAREDSQDSHSQRDPHEPSAREQALEFYQRITKRSDVRELLSRLAKK